MWNLRIFSRNIILLNLKYKYFATSPITTNSDNLMQKINYFILRKGDYERAAGLLLNKGGQLKFASPRKRHFIRILSHLSRFGQFRLAHKLYKRLISIGIVPSMVVYSMYFNAALNELKFSHVSAQRQEKILRQIRAVFTHLRLLLFNLKTNEMSVVNPAISLLEVEDSFERKCSSDKASVLICYNAYLSVIARTGAILEIFNVLDELLHVIKIKPDSYTLTTLLEACVCRKQDGCYLAFKCFHFFSFIEFTDWHGAHYYLFLKALLHCGLGDRIEKQNFVLPFKEITLEKAMNDGGKSLVRLNAEHAAQKLLDVPYCIDVLQDPPSQLATKDFDRMPNTDNGWLRLEALGGIDSIVACMENNGILPSIQHLTVFLSILPPIEHSSIDNYEDKVFWLLEKHSLKPTIDIFNVALKRRVLLKRDVKIIFQQMLQHGIEPNQRTFQSLLFGCNSAKNLESVIGWMKAFNIYPDLNFFEVLLKQERPNMVLLKRILELISDHQLCITTDFLKSIELQISRYSDRFDGVTTKNMWKFKAYQRFLAFYDGWLKRHVVKVGRSDEMVAKYS